MDHSELRVGFLTYDLQEFTADCLSRLQRRASFRLKAYPILPRAATDWIAFDYRPSQFKARHFTVNRPGSTPEGLMASVNLGAAWACARENDVVVLFGIHGGTALVIALFARLLRRKLISVNQTLPPLRERQRRWWIRLLKRWVLRRCRVHVVQTPAAADNLADVYGMDRSAFVEAPFNAGFQVFRQFVDEVAPNRQALRLRYGWKPDECVFLFVGTLLRFKGVRTILHAVRRLQDGSRDFRVVLCGPDSPQAGEPSIDAFRAEAARLGVADRVLFTGRRSLSELPCYYAAADAFLLPTQKDCWPKVLVEAAACRLPLVTTTSCGAAGNLVADGKTGYVIEPDDAEALAGAMQRLLDPQQRQRMGQAAYDFCVAFCDEQKEAEGFVRAIEMAAGRSLQRHSLEGTHVAAPAAEARSA